MLAEQLFGHTLREAPADAELASHRLLLRAAFVRRVAAGVYAWLPLGVRVRQNVERIVREEVDAAGGVEVQMPALLPRDLLEATGRADQSFWGGELYTLQDAGGREMFLGPTHEEVFTAVASTELGSYRDLPAVPYQVQTKFRYAPRPRGGLLRAREFLMLDAYSFDVDAEAMAVTYGRMRAAFARIFERFALRPVVVDADPGVMGGGLNHEFTLPAASGEDTFVSCEGCGYAANTDAAASRIAVGADLDDAASARGPEKVHTPGMVSVEEVSSFLGCDPSRLVKALLFRTPDGYVCALVPGHRELNEHKLRGVLGVVPVMLSDADFAASPFVKGYAGPVGLTGARIVADESLRGRSALVCGANEADHHLTGAEPGRDFEPDHWADLALAEAGDGCPRCDGELSAGRGIELAHIFQLGTKYSAPMGAEFTDESGRRRPLFMGCYGLGISRVVAAIAELHHDDKGLVWPRSVAPFEVAVVVPTSSDTASAAAASLHDALIKAGITVLLDSRAGVSAGAKFADADLIGCPLQVVVGKTFERSGRVEVVVRATGARVDIEPEVEPVARHLAALDRSVRP